MLWTRGKAYPQELRERVLVAYDEGDRVGRIARRFKVSVFLCVEGHRPPREERRDHRPAASEPRAGETGRPPGDDPAQTDHRHRSDAGRAAGVAGEGAQALRQPAGDPQDARPDEDHAKKKLQHAAEQDRPDVAEARAAWRTRQPMLNPAKLVFIDETGVTTNLARRYGWGLMGQRVIGKVPHGHWRTSTFIAGLRNSGIIAPCVFNCAMDGELLLAYVEQQ